MSARIAPIEPVAAPAPVAEYRPPAPPVADASIGGSSVATRKNPYVEAAKVSGAVSGAVEGMVESTSPAREEAPAPPMPLEQPGTDYVRAVISGALSPRPKSAQELFMRTGSGWIPPESEYRLADKTA